MNYDYFNQFQTPKITPIPYQYHTPPMSQDMGGKPFVVDVDKVTEENRN